jgi:hypothetical protein
VAALRAGCAIWDQRAAQGGPTSHYTWIKHDPQLAVRDGVHLTTQGYRTLGARLFDDLIDAYTRFTLHQDHTLRTTPILAIPSLEEHEETQPNGQDPDALFLAP